MPIQAAVHIASAGWYAFFSAMTSDPVWQGFYVFIRAVQQLVAKNTGTVIVGLAGPSGAGKTVFSQKIQNLMPGAVCVYTAGCDCPNSLAAS